MRHIQRLATHVLPALLAGAALLAPRQGLAQRAVDLSLRHLGNVTHFDGVRQSAVDVVIPAEGAGGSGRVTLGWLVSGGAITDRARDTAFVGAGGALHLRIPHVLRGAAVQASFTPTWTEAAILNDRAFGGHVHFTSALSFRLYLDRARTGAVALRAQHTSNAGLDDANPGLDLAGLEVSWRFGETP